MPNVETLSSGTLTKNEYKLFQIAYNDINWKENKAFWRKKIKGLLEQIGLGDLWMKAHYGRVRLGSIRNKIIGIMRVNVRFGAILIPEYLDFHPGRKS